MEQILNIVLFYSLGFGLVMALLTGITLLLTRSASPLLRYCILVGLLGLFTFSIMITGYIKLSTTDKPVANTESQRLTPKTIKSDQVAAVLSIPAVSETNNLLVLSRTFLQNNARTILIIWLLVVLMKSIKLGSNLMELHYLKTRQLFPAGKYWEEEVIRLAEQIGLRKTVKIMQSGLTKVPLVIGHFKPVILIPLGMITAIRPQEIEMMLLHELAHIKRVDFLVNMLQHMLEVLFFFNPAVLWISSLIRRERENCCDEMVLKNADGKQNYIQALLSFREYQLNVPAYAMAFAKQSNLINRVKRIAYQKNMTLNSIEKGCLMVAVLLLCSFGMLRATTSTLQPAEFQKPKATKTTATSESADTTRKSGKPKLKQIVSKQKKETILTQSSVTSVTGPTTIGLDLESTLADSSFNDLVDSSDIRLDLKVLGELTSKLVNTTVMSTINVALDSSLYYTSNINSNTKIDVTTNINTNTNVKTGTKVKLAPLTQPNPHVRLNAKPLLRIGAKTSGFTEKLFQAMERAGINTKSKNFNFHITNQELTVNGKKQPDKVLKKILKDYLKTDKDTIDFTYDRN